MFSGFYKEIMTNLEEIEILIDEKGKIRISVNGIPAKNCLDSTAELEKMLGDKVVSRQMTPEFLEQPVVISSSQKTKIKVGRN